jgi:hypothetical protein
MLIQQPPAPLSAKAKDRLAREGPSIGGSKPEASAGCYGIDLRCREIIGGSPFRSAVDTG